MRVLSEGFRRVNARGEGIDYEAKQNSTLKFGTLIAGVCISSFSMFTTTPALGQVEGKDVTPVVIGGQTESKMLQDFLAWALLNNTELYDKYKDSSTFDEVSVDDVLIWREDTEDPVLQVTEISIGEIDIEDDETFTLTIGGLIITCTEGTDFTKTGDPETDKQLLLNALALKANQSGQLPTGYIVEVIDGKLVITGNGDGSFVVSVTSETNDTEFVVEKKQEFQRVESLLAGSFSINASCQRFLIESRTTSASTTLSSDVFGEVEFNRTANANIIILFDGGSANWEAPVFWENMDVYWDSPESPSTPYLAKVHNRDADASFFLNGSIGTAYYESTVFWNYMDVDWDEEDTSTGNQFFSTVHERDADASITVNGGVGTADYESTLFWEFIDVDWDEEDTSTGQQFFSTVHERNTSASMSMVVTVGQAGWASDFVWEGLDINWDDEVSGQFIQGNIDASFNLFGTSSFVLADIENRTASANIEINSSVACNIVRQRTATSSSAFTMIVGSAGWASTLIWEQADVEWHLTSGQLIQEGASSSLSLSTNATGEIDTIFAINASSQFSLSTNLNSELIQGWNSETTLMENLTRNWEAI